MSVSRRDAQRVPTLIGVDSATGLIPTLLEVDATSGELLVKSTTAKVTGDISTGNSTTTVLDADEVFTGTSEEVKDYASLTIIIDASHDSAADGISIEFSPDGTNWDKASPYTFDVSVTPSLTIIKPIVARYFRIVYTNGGTLQTHFRMQTILHSSPVLANTYRLADSESPELTGTLVKAGITAQASGSGLFVPVQATGGGNLKISLQDKDAASYLVDESVKKYYTNAGAVTDGIIWSPAAGKRWHITDIFINVSAASVVTLEDDLAAGDSVVWKAELIGNSGWSHSFTTPLFSGEDAADLIVTSTAGNIYVTVTGYEA